MAVSSRSKSLSSDNSPRRTRQRNTSSVLNKTLRGTKSETNPRKTGKTTVRSQRNRTKQQQPTQVATSSQKKRTKQPKDKEPMNPSAHKSTCDNSSSLLSTILQEPQIAMEETMEQNTEYCEQASVVDDIPEYFNTEYNKSNLNKGNQSIQLPKDFQMKCLEEKFADERQQIRDQYLSKFEKWLAILEEFNMLCYGQGSKRHVLDAFAEYCSKRSTTIIVHGYRVNFSLKQLVMTIEKEILQLPEELSNRRTPAEQVRNMERQLSKDSFPSSIFLVIHNIDGPKMQSSQVQEILSHIASIPKIKLIASIDHLNAALLWNRTLYQRLNWYWEQVSTGDSYLYEISDTSFLINGEGDESRIKAATFLFSTLTKNARQIFLELAAMLEQMQRDKLSNEEKSVESPAAGVGFHSFYEHCRKKFLVSNPNSLKSVLKELKDHEVVGISSSSVSAETIKITLKPNQLEAVISLLQGQSETS